MNLFRKIVSVCVVVIVSTPVLVFGALAYGDTSSRVSIVAFKMGYLVMPFTWSYLTFYSPMRRDVSAGGFPREVDEFLCERAETTSDLNELDAIVHFYSIQAGGREGDCIFRTSDKTRKKIAARIVANFSETDLRGQIILLEQVRLGSSLGKGRIGLGPGASEAPSSAEEWEAWGRKAYPFAKEKYIEWWQAPTTWEEKKLTNPLEDQPVRVYECCG